MKEQSNKKAFVFCALAFASYYVILLCAIGYATVFLRSTGISSAGSGTVVALACIVAAILQPILGQISDRSRRIDWKKVSLFLSVLLLASFVTVYFSKQNTVNIIFFFAVIVFANCINPFLNESSFYYKRNGISVNFGIVRGIGSLSYALISYLFQFADLDESLNAIITTGITASVLLIISVRMLPRVGDAGEKTDELPGDRKKQYAIKEFFKQNKIFMIFWIALIFIMTFQNLFSANLIDIVNKAGGTVSEMGISLALAAIVELPVMFLFTKFLKKSSPEKLMLFGAFFYIVRCVLFLVAGSMVLVYVAQALQMLTYAVITPAAVYLSDKLIDKKFSNTGQSLIGFTVTAGTVFGFFIGGVSNQFHGATVMLLIGLAATILGFIFSLIANLMSGRPAKPE